MSTFGKCIRERRKALGPTQRQLASRVRFEDGHSISAPYLNDIEHDLRKPPRAHLIEQFAQALSVNADLLVYLAGRLPQDIRDRDASHEEVVRACQVFRQRLARHGNGVERVLRHAVIEEVSSGLSSD